MTLSDIGGEADDPLRVLKIVAEHSPVGIQIYDRNGYTVYSNEQHHRIFGNKPPPDYCVLQDQQVKAMGWLHLIQKAFKGEPAVVPLFWFDARTISNLSPESREYVQKWGKKAAIETHLIPIFDNEKKVSHVVFVFKDVTAELYMQEEREKAIKDREEYKNMVQNILDQTPAVIFIKDLDGKHVFANRQLCRIFGKPMEFFLGKTAYEFIPKDVADEFRRNDLKVLSNMSHQEVEETVVHADGTKHTYLSLKFPLVDSSGKASGICGIATDITTHRNMERELNNAKRIEALGLLAGGVAHNFNNNLGVILLLTKALLDSDAKRKIDWRKSVKSIQSEVLAATLLTRQLLAFGRQQIFRPRNISLETVVLRMKDLLEKALGADIKFSINISGDLWFIFADPIQIEQILTNLCFNARDAMPNGGKINIATRNDGDRVELKISDNGKGIKQEDLDRIFEPFFTTKTDGQGTGLGLSTVYGLVRSLDGEISVQSSPNKGTTFILHFPKSKTPLLEDDVAPESTSADLKGTGTILLVEDQKKLRDLTAQLLKEHGYKVVQAKDGKSALKIWKGVAKSVDLIVTDVIMPDIDGPELIRRLSSGRAKTRFKTLFVSAYSEVKLSDYGIKQKDSHFIQKPFSPAQILSKIKELLNS